MDIGATRQALADKLTAVGIRCEPFVQDSPNVPCAVVFPSAFDYGGGTFERPFPLFVVLLLAGAVDNRASQQTLDAWISEGSADSVPDALKDEGRFVVTSLRSYGTTTTVEGGVRYFSAELEVTAYS